MGTTDDKTPEGGKVGDDGDRLARVEQDIAELYPVARSLSVVEQNIADLYTVARTLSVVVQDLQKQVTRLERKP